MNELTTEQEQAYHREADNLLFDYYNARRRWNDDGIRASADKMDTAVLKVAHLLASNAQLRTALEAFAAMAALFDGHLSPPMGREDDAAIYTYHAGEAVFEITVADVRRARAALAAEARVEAPAKEDGCS